MLGKLKRFLGVFFVFAMVFAMMPGNVLGAYAEEADSLSVTVTALPEFKEGETIAEANATVEVPEGFTTVTKWEVWGTVEDEEGDSYEDWTEATAETFSATDVYRCTVLITADDGSALPADWNVKYAEGLPEGSDWQECDEDGNAIALVIELGYYTLTTVIDKVEVTASEVAEGNAPSVDQIVFWSGEEEVTGDVADVDWEWSEDGGEESGVTVFEAEKNYQLSIELTAKEGYSFAEEIALCVNEEEAYGFFDIFSGSLYMDYSLLTPVDHVEIELPDVKEGEPIFTEVTIGCDCEKCEIAVYWCDEEGEDVTEETFVAGNTYTLQLAYNNYSGAALSEDFVFIINGEEYEPTNLETENGQAWLELTYEILDIVTPTIEITALPEIAEGTAIADANVSIAVSEHFTAETQWQVWSTVTDEDGNEDEEYVPVTEETFSDTDVYCCVVVVTADSGYAFSEDCTVKCSEGMTISSWGYEEDNVGNITTVEIEIGNYTFTKVINKVEVTASEVAEGKEASVGEIVCWAGNEKVTGFEINACEWIDLDTYETVETFEREHMYQLQIELKAKEGYSFAEDVAVYIDGEETSGFNYPCHISFSKEYNALLTPVDHVEIELPDVKEGEPIFAEVTIGCDCEKCEIAVYWCDEEGEDVTDETFVAGNTYTLQLAYNNYSGATLSEDFVFIINGEEYEPTTLYSEYGQADLMIIYMIGEVVTVTAVIPEEDPEEETAQADVIINVSEDISYEVSEVPIGSEVTICVTDENFTNWLNKYGRIVTTEKEDSFILLDDIELTMSRKGIVGVSALVEFVSVYNQVIASGTYSAGDNITVPDGPSRVGYTFTGWSLTKDEISAKITAGETHIAVKPVYEKVKTERRVYVFVDQNADPTAVAGVFAPGDVTTVTAPNVAGKVFLHWEDREGNVLGYDSSYSMQIGSEDVYVRAVYGTESEAAKPVIAITNVFTTELNGKCKLSFSATRDVPDGYTLIEHGMYFYSDNIAEWRKYDYRSNVSEGVFILNIDVTGHLDEEVSVKGYICVQNADGEVEEICSAPVSCSFNELN